MILKKKTYINSVEVGVISHLPTTMLQPTSALNWFFLGISEASTRTQWEMLEEAPFEELVFFLYMLGSYN